MTRIQNPQAYLSRAELLARNPVFRALGRKNMPIAGQVDLALAARRAFESAQLGTFNAADLDTLVGTSNVCLVLAEKHCIAADVEACKAAQAAILRADARVLDGKSWNFDGEGRLAWLDLLDIHEQLIALLGQSALTDAVLTVINRRSKGHVVRIKRGAEACPTQTPNPESKP